MVKKSLLIVLTFCFLLSLSCNKNDSYNKKTILFSFKPYSLILKDLNIQKYKATVLFSSNKDLNTKKLSKQQVKMLKEADLIVLNGYIEKDFIKQIEPYENKVVYVSQMINQVKVKLNKEYPYYWLNPELYIDYIRGMNSEFGKLEPNMRVQFDIRTNDLISEYQQLIENIDIQANNISFDYGKEFFFLEEYLTSRKKNKELDNKVDKIDNNFDIWQSSNYENSLDYFTKNYLKPLN
ncbi:MAG TPA: zinc ABC transporter substrate-binding protein [Candidatus Cloacimonadota bacterium]|nr:zinc ABC transporter substrate-binding protein [Candidatus Cloacimonadales bacterium]HPY96869.1 zinc ABC transporter substrate-binding protein [Candidatus Cloacimonadota bacterium]HQB40224.1 zinc ABC transporter substrate-binding protein [Candidatus Cloacimonadota bacterium]